MKALVAVRRFVPVVLLALLVVACGPEPPTRPDDSPSAKLHPTGILLVDVGEQIQPLLPAEALKQAFSDATVLAEANGNDLGFPWFDSSSGELVLSAVTARGRELITAASIAAPHGIRDVAHGAAELIRIQDEVTRLRSQGVPDAELIYGVSRDHRDNRTLIVISAMSRPLLDALAERFPLTPLRYE